MIQFPAHTVRAITALTLVAGLSCGGTAAVARTTTPSAGACYNDPGRGSYTQTAVFPGAGKATWTFSVDVLANDQCEGTDIAEVGATRQTERGATRGDDRATEAAMEDRKKEGYF